MIAQAARLLVRAAGWLLTPIVSILAAGIGAMLGAFIAPRLSATGGLIAAAIGGLLGATVGLMLWLRLLRQSPELREVLAVTTEGVPTDQAIAEVLGEDPQESAERPTQ